MSPNEAGEHHYTFVTNIKRNEVKKRRKRGVLAFDFEARSLEDKQRPEENCVRIGEHRSYFQRDTICKIKYRPYKKKNYIIKTFITNSEKTSARQFLDWLHKERTENRRYTCVAHNGSRYDFFFLIKEFTRQEQLHSPPQLRGTSIISLTYQEHIFKDTACFMPNTLKNLCDSFQIDEGKITECEYRGKTMESMELCMYKPELNFDDFMALKETEPEFWKRGRRVLRRVR